LSGKRPPLEEVVERMEHIRSSTEETIPSNPECSQFGEEKMGLVWGPKIK